MNKFLRNLENKIGRFAIPRLYIVVIACIVIGYILSAVSPRLYSQLLFIPSYVVLRHQYWRLFTWIFTIPYSITSIFTVIFLPINLFFYYSLGRMLEDYWGKFIYNLYVIGGALLTDIFVLLGGYYYYLWSDTSSYDVSTALDEASTAMSLTRYMLMSIFLAFAVVGGDHKVYLYFVIPVKMKWLALLDLFLLAYNFIEGGFFTRIVIVCSIINFAIYYFITKSPSFSGHGRRSGYVKARQKGRRKKSRVTFNDDGTIEFPGARIISPGSGNPEGISIHKCAVCGRTEKDSPDMEFRFCSKCNGNYEYCSEHLYTHQHIK